MNYGEELQTGAQALVETVVTSPRLLGGAIAGTTSLSIANALEMFQGTLSACGIVTGMIATVLLARVHWIKYKNEVVQNKILTAQLASMGAEPIIEKKL
jgi:hypothetical protein